MLLSKNSLPDLGQKVLLYSDNKGFDIGEVIIIMDRKFWRTKPCFVHPIEDFPYWSILEKPNASSSYDPS